jgi:hypothetical protein
MVAVVTQLRAALAQHDRASVIRCLRAFVVASHNDQHIAAFQAGAPALVLDAMEIWGDVHLQTLGLACLFHVWACSLPPFDDTTLIPRAVELAIRGVKTNEPSLLIVGFRLLRCHSLCAANVHALPQIAEVVSGAMVSHPDDAALQEWGAMILMNLMDVDKTEVVNAHGQFGLVVLHTSAITAAGSTRHGDRLLVDGRAWSEHVLETFPKLRPK